MNASQASGREKRIAFSTKEIPVFTMMVCVGVELARMEPGARLRLHQFDHANSNGDERIASPYQRQSLEAAIRQTISRLRLSMTVRIDGLDVVVER